MKKTIFLAAIAALCTLVSCQKEDTLLRDSNGDLIFTASIAGPDTRTSINTSDGVVTWSENDEITIKDAASNSVVYYVSKIDAQGKATFEKKSGQDDKRLGAGPYTATYLDGFNFKNQTYSATVPALPMDGKSIDTNPTELYFTVNCGLLVMSLTSTSNDYLSNCRAYKTDTPTGDYYLTFNNTSINTTNPLVVYLPLPKGIYWLWFNNGNSYSAAKLYEISISNNNINNASAKLDFEAN